MQVNIIVSPPVTLERSLFVSIKIDGMVRVAAATPHVKVADCPYNKNEMAKMIREAEGEAEAILKVQQANADGIKMLKEAGADAAVLKLKSLEAFEKVADGQATTILLPAELQGIASVAETFKAAAGKKAE